MKGISAVIATLLLLVITLGLVGLAYGYITGIFGAKTGKVFSVISADCAGGTATVVLRNDGTVNMVSTDINLTAITPAAGEAGVCTAGAVPPMATGATGTLTFTNCATGRTHTWRASGPSNTERIVFHCP
jgi:flagellin-like protein